MFGLMNDLAGLLNQSTWKLEILSSEFCQLPGDWGVSGMANLGRMSLIKCY